MKFSDVEILRRIFRKVTVANNLLAVRENTTYINFKCPHCDDVQSRKRVGRGYFTVKERGGSWYAHYTCHNGDCEYNEPMGAVKYLKKNHPLFYEEFKRETNASKSKGFKFNIRNKFRSKNEKVENDWDRIEQEFKKKMEEDEKAMREEDVKAMKFFIPITEPSLLKNTAIKYCEDRLIPKHVYEKFFVATKGKYKNRLIIPYFRKDAKPSYFQARALYDYITPKYKNRSGEKQPYNIDFVDPSKPVFVFEGAFDSIFVENAFSLGGVHVNDEIKKRFDKNGLYFIFDNDTAGRASHRKMLEQGYHVFNWEKFLKDNDIVSAKIKDWNALVLETNKNFWKIDDIIDYFHVRESK